MRGEDDVGRDAGQEGVDVEAITGASAGGAGGVGLRDGLAFDAPAERGEIGGEKLACGGLVVGGRFDVDELLGELDGIDWH